MSQRTYTATIYGHPSITRRSPRALFRALVRRGTPPDWIDREERRGRGWAESRSFVNIDEWRQCVWRYVVREWRKAGCP